MPTPFARDYSLDLPDLEDAASIEIVPDNIRATQALYFAAMLERMKLFQVADRLVELFASGQLPIGGTGGKRLYGYWKQTPQRLGEADRRNLYARTFGLPAGDDRVSNREFNSLWMQFIGAAAVLTAGADAGTLREPAFGLARNLSFYGGGFAQYAARELVSQIREIIDLLSDADIRNAFGARDIWSVIDHVSTLELGGSANVVRYRTMASSGAAIMGWLVDNRMRIASCEPWPVDRNLLDACESWLAVAGIDDGNIEDLSDPE